MHKNRHVPVYNYISLSFNLFDFISLLCYNYQKGAGNMKKIEFENINHNKILIITDIHHCGIDK